MFESLITKQKVQFILENYKFFKKFKKIDFKNYSKTFIFVDSKFYSLNKNFINLILKSSKSNFFIIKIVSKETIKDLRKFEQYAKYLVDKNCSKHDLIIAIGGGTIIDLIGFLSSVLLRGINLYLIPTNLIGMADASTAGKTGLNLGSLKNLIGTIYLPSKVYINTFFLRSCSKADLRQGWSEILKYGLLGSRKLVKMTDIYFKNKNDEAIIGIIKETIKIRLKIMKINPLASNLGHTFGHAIEKLTNHKITHGDAVSIGTVFALKYAINKKLITKTKYKKILSLMNSIGLVTKLGFKFSERKLLSYMLKDKKSFDDKVGLILIKDIGMPYMNNANPFYYCKKSEMLNFLKSVNK